MNKYLWLIGLFVVFTSSACGQTDTITDTVHDTVLVTVPDTTTEAAKYYELARDGIEHGKSTVDALTTWFGILATFLAIFITLVLAVMTYMNLKARSEAMNEIKEVRQRRDEIDRICEHLRNLERTAKERVADLNHRLAGQAEELAKPVQATEAVREPAVRAAGEGKSAKHEEYADHRTALITEFDKKLDRISKLDAEDAVREYEAVKTATELLNLPDSTIPASLRRNMGLNYYRLREWDKALREFRAYLENKPDDAEVLFYCGFCNTKLGNLREALESYETSARIEPRAVTYNDWGLTLLKKYHVTRETNWLSQAEEKVNRSIELAPDERRFLYNLACVYALMEKKPEMLRALKEAIEYGSDCKKWARTDEDFEKYWDDPDFIALTKEDDESSHDADNSRSDS